MDIRKLWNISKNGYQTNERKIEINTINTFSKKKNHFWWLEPLFFVGCFVYSCLFLTKNQGNLYSSLGLHFQSIAWNVCTGSQKYHNSPHHRFQSWIWFSFFWVIVHFTRFWSRKTYKGKTRHKCFIKLHW